VTGGSGEVQPERLRFAFDVKRSGAHEDGRSPYSDRVQLSALEIHFQLESARPAHLDALIHAPPYGPVPRF
jgi:hypothetical protein